MRCHEDGARPERPAYTLGDVFRRYGAQYRATHQMPAQQRKVMRAIEQCRTAALGGHVQVCGSCGHEQNVYNSCRDRHCPTCQGRARRRWVAARVEELLPIRYFHVVFTLPHEINELARWNQKVIYNLLFRAASETLLAFGERRFGGQIGFTSVLHTWGQTLVEHLHLHNIVTGGALSRDGERWVSCRNGYLFPVRALRKVYRGKFCGYLMEAFEKGALTGGDEMAMLADGEAFGRYVKGLARQSWVVYSKAPMAGPEQVVRYIGQYSHRVAISNARILGIEDNCVRFGYKDYRTGERDKEMRLGAEQFIGRYLRHVVPKRYVRIRHYGVLAPGSKAKLARCREVLGAGAVESEEGIEGRGRQSGTAIESEPEAGKCPECGSGPMMRVRELPRMCGPPRREGRAA